ncbi:MAG TPA: hypothetical protein VGI95_17265 [Caulobacteraceae bacterium]
MPAPRRAKAATPAPERSPAEVATALIREASARCDAASVELAGALKARREAIAAYQRLRVHPMPSLLSKLISPRSCDAGLAAAEASQYLSVYVAPPARRTFVAQAESVIGRFPAKQEVAP